ncbi:MAG: response regulator [Steroidobacteraceae bacterium]
MDVLLVEDDTMLADAVSQGLRQEGWTVECVSDAVGARLAALNHTYDAILLDLGLPGASGLTFLKALRANYETTPVLIVTARDKLSDRVAGLDAGADDYIVKPFQIDELCARLRAVVRRSQGRVSPMLSYDQIVVDPAKRLVTRDGQPVQLSLNEFRTLVTLLERLGTVVTREALEDAVYGSSGTIESNTIAVFIHHLRRKLGEELIVTVHGYGYRMGESQ